MTNSSFLKKLLFALSVVFFVSCDKDFNEVGSDIVGDDIHTDMTRYDVDVVAYDRPTGAVQTNNMALNQLGIYDNPVFGKTVSHFVTQIEMKSENPTLYEPVIDSVYLYIPYYNTVTEVKDGETEYKLDSIYGKKEATFKLQMYRNGYYLRDTDPGATDNIQRYYSDDRAMVENLKVGTPMYEKTDFAFSPLEVKIESPKPGADNKIVERKEPGMFVYLDNALINDIFFSEANRGNLLNNNIFKNYFRGLYFKVEQTGEAVLNMPRFSEGTITVKYHDYESKTTGGVSGPDTSKPKISKTMTFNLKGNTINFFDTTFNSTFNTAITTSDDVNGDDKLYVKGGQGSMAIINLNDAQLQALTKDVVGQKVLINEANLVFYADESIMNQAGAIQPNRLYLYDLKNNKPIIDYSIDGTSSVSRPKNNKTIYGGFAQVIQDGPNAGKVRYRIRLTNHINNIINRDSTNVKLGLVVTENINLTSSGKLKTQFAEGTTEVKMVPLGSIQHPFGTVLYGSNSSVEEGRRIKLEIYYTQPK